MNRCISAKDIVYQSRIYHISICISKRHVIFTAKSAVVERKSVAVATDPYPQVTTPFSDGHPNKLASNIIMQSSDMCIVDGGPAPAAANSIWHWLKQGIDLDPTAPALQASHVPADYLSNLLIASKFDAQCHNFSWSYAQLEEAAYTLAAHLVSRGIGPGDVIVTVLSDSVEWAIFFWAAIQLGAMFVPLNPWLVSKPDELRYLITVAEGTVLITNEPRAVEEIDLVTNRSQDPYKVKMMCHMGGSAVQGWEHLRQVICDRSAAERKCEAVLPIRGRSASSRPLSSSSSSSEPD